MDVKYWVFGLIAFAAAVLWLVRSARSRKRETAHLELPLEGRRVPGRQAQMTDADDETAPAVLGPPESRRKSA